MKPLVFVDANVLMYSRSRDASWSSGAGEALRECASNWSMFTDNEVCHEILHHLRRVGRGHEAPGVLTDLHDALAGEIESTSYADVAYAAALSNRFAGASTGDLIHLAVMHRRGCAAILSADRDFDSLPGIRRLDPFNIASWRQPET